ncbi:MAG: SpoIIE family protein phosphatase [Opitutaceae bacterium]
MTSIRLKLTANLVLAGALPLVAAIVTLFTYGYRQQVNNTGSTYRSEAEHVVMNLEAITQRQVDAVHDLLILSDLAESLQAHIKTMPKADPILIRDIDKNWADLDKNSSLLTNILSNRIAERMRDFQRTHPLFAEVFVTDMSGRLVAATHKTSDYYQADENWWHRASDFKTWDAWIGGLDFDKSAKVLSLDVSMPVFTHEADEAGKPVGIMKAVIDVSPLFASIPFLLSDQGAEREIIREDGTVVLRLLDENFSPGGTGLTPRSMERLKEDPSGWHVEQFQNGEGIEMIGIAPLHLFGVYSMALKHASEDPYFVIVRHEADALLSPLRRQIIFIVAAGILLTGFSVWLGNYFSNKHLLVPLETIRRAAQSVAATTNPEKRRKTEHPFIKYTDTSTEDMVAKATEIQTNDELGRFSKDFVSMAHQLLNYQNKLEADVAAKTAEIQKDLSMARDFQQALLPQTYPLVPSEESDENAITLSFGHAYHPTAQLSGDFYDLIKINDHCVGIIVADVMGHGTRSALVTAIFRALLQEATGSAQDPAKFLAALNKAFYSIIEETGQVVFVTAVYLVIDTITGKASCASAGHPSPLRANRSTGIIEPVFSQAYNGPALGLLRESTHQALTWDMLDEDMVFLFTDGIIEASDLGGDEYGVERLTQSIRSNLNHDLSKQVTKVVDSIMRFTHPNPIQDDVCLIAIKASLQSTSSSEETLVDAAKHL